MAAFSPIVCASEASQLVAQIFWKVSQQIKPRKKQWKC